VGERIRLGSRAVTNGKPARSIRGLEGKRMRWGAAIALAAAVILIVVQLPVNVPDTSSPPFASNVVLVHNWQAVGQSFVAERDGLSELAVILATAQRIDQAEIAFHVKDSPEGEPLRTVRRSLSSLPEGNALRYHAGGLSERWETFEFEPIVDSAGRKLYFSIEGEGIPTENAVGVLTFFHSRYPQGEAFVNEAPVNAHVNFRAYSQGQVKDYLLVIARNLTYNRPGPLSTPAPYLVLAVLYVTLAGALLAAVGRAGAFR
jgi:hypothetical protein